VASRLLKGINLSKVLFRVRKLAVERHRTRSAQPDRYPYELAQPLGQFKVQLPLILINTTAR
jgi:hypothetical protein